MGLLTNLYPPIINSYMPAFVRDTPCRIYFALSSYNSIEEIKNVQITIVNLNNNNTAFKNSLYPTEVKISEILIDDTIADRYKYYIEIKPEELINGIFELNTYYKVQLRFTDAAAPELETNIATNTWLYDNLDFFSEWSTACLIKGIEKPSLVINELVKEDNNIITSDILTISGKYYYEKNGDTEKEYVKFFRCILYNNEGKLIEDSQEIYPTDINELKYTFTYLLGDKQNYSLKITFCTNNNQTKEAVYPLTVNLEASELLLKGSIAAKINQENGSIDVTTTILYQNFANNSGELIIKRASSKNNFKYYQTIGKVLKLSDLNSKIVYTYQDITIESGIWYKYGMQIVDSNGKYSNFIYMDEPIMIVLDTVYLCSHYTQLNIKLDAKIDSFKQKVSESVTETIGSKFPFVRRNGSINYKQFTLSGTISCHCDESNRFTDEEEIYKESKDLYLQQNEENNITSQNDILYERFFRDRVIEFLYEDNIKLFRSTTEGNILIRLTNISLTPNPTLGRMIYSFSATAYEIADFNLDNLIKYNIYSLNLEVKPVQDYVLKANKYVSDESVAYITTESINLNSLLLVPVILGWESEEEKYD